MGGDAEPGDLEGLRHLRQFLHGVNKIAALALMRGRVRGTEDLVVLRGLAGVEKVVLISAKSFTVSTTMPPWLAYTAVSGASGTSSSSVATSSSSLSSAARSAQTAFVSEDKSLDCFCEPRSFSSCRSSAKTSNLVSLDSVPG